MQGRAGKGKSFTRSTDKRGNERSTGKLDRPGFGKDGIEILQSPKKKKNDEEPGLTLCSSTFIFKNAKKRGGVVKYGLGYVGRIVEKGTISRQERGKGLNRLCR